MSSMTSREFNRFWGRVALPDENDCMLWTGLRNPRGYGRAFVGGVYHQANRLSLIFAEGEPTDPRMHAAHSCPNKHCVAPSHLRWATPAENEADKAVDGLRLTEVQIQAIRLDRVRTGDSHLAIARRHGVSKTTVQRHLKVGA
jgi:hypothetical protein